MPDIAAVTCKFQQRVSSEGHPLTEVLYTWDGGCALTRLPYAIPDTPYARAGQVGEFCLRKRRLARTGH